MRSLITLSLTFLSLVCAVGQHPSLTLTETGVQRIKAGMDGVDLFKREVAKTRASVDAAILKGIDTPVPKDMAGGYTHEQHKLNYKNMQLAGNLYQLTGEDKYADFVKEMLLSYAKLYPNLPLHPTMKSYATGKIFWQCLNDANWLVFSSQAYDCIYNYLSAEERTILERDLFVPFANFLSEDNPRFFNRIHNHSTWANAAVGMIALAMDNDTLLEKALYGLKKDGIKSDEYDDDGRAIKKEDVTKAGFLAQLDYSFSPDGYFAEGPYYQRYAVFPFLIFSHALHNKKPELKIFEYRDAILKKATASLLQLTNMHGAFFPINDAQKGMSYKAFEVVNAVNLSYMIDDTQEDLLDWAALQGEVVLNEAGYKVAKALTNHEAKMPIKKSQIFGDGVSGKEGGVAVLRQGTLELLFKFATQGMGHGHFDRLSYSLVDSNGEIVQDYGAVRWVNIDQKGGGRYLPENKTFGKQSIAHNTVVVNGASHFNGKTKQAEKYHPELYASDFSNEQFKFVSAVESNAYLGIELHRSLYLIDDEALDETVMLDIMRTKNVGASASLQLPIWFVGHTMKQSFECPKESNNMSPLGTTNGYQHIWKECTTLIDENQYQFNWLNKEKFYTLTAVAENGDSLTKGRLGANDPDYNFRPDPVLIQGRNCSKLTTFVNLIEPHGSYDRYTEIPKNPFAKVKTIKKIYEDDSYLIASFSTGLYQWTIMLCTSDSDQNKIHKISTKGINYQWRGVTKLEKNTK